MLHETGQEKQTSFRPRHVHRARCPEMVFALRCSFPSNSMTNCSCDKRTHCICLLATTVSICAISKKTTHESRASMVFFRAAPPFGVRVPLDQQISSHWTVLKHRPVTLQRANRGAVSCATWQSALHRRCESQCVTSSSPCLHHNARGSTKAWWSARMSTVVPASAFAVAEKKRPRINYLLFGERRCLMLLMSQQR